MARPMFYIVGVLPFLLGAILAWYDTGMFSAAVFILGSLGAVSVMLSAYLAGEYWDIDEDRLATTGHPSRFSGGSGVVVQGLVERRHVLTGAIGALAVAGVIAIVLVVLFRTGPWTIPLGMLGILGGFYYSSRPVRWVSTGLGELWIAFCYGWLPVSTAYYLQTSGFSPVATWISLPIACTIFSVILMNEFPDYEADRACNKRNLVVRLGRPNAAVLYGVLAILSWILLLLSPFVGVPCIFVLFIIPFLVLSVILAVQVMRGGWIEPHRLQQLCGGTILVNIGVSGAYIVAFIASA
jgi:1,4-dihydroxy-2-naphthoate octaprenyltransferase